MSVLAYFLQDQSSIFLPRYSVVSTSQIKTSLSAYTTHVWLPVQEVYFIYIEKS